MKYILVIVFILVGCGRSHDHHHDTVIVYEEPTQEVIEPDFGPKYISCYSWNTGRPVWGPEPATQLIYKGAYAYIKTYPSGRWVKICAECFGL